MSKSKMPLATIINLIVENTEMEEQDIMQLSLTEIEELREMTSAKLRTAFELEQKVKKFYRENKK
jgi:hypothetical protein